MAILASGPIRVAKCQSRTDLLKNYLVKADWNLDNRIGDSFKAGHGAELWK